MASNSANGALNHFGPSCMETYSGARVDLRHPKAEDINPEDIITALSNTCRYGGHVKNYYSVAEHSVLVSALVVYLGHEPLALPALLHDAAEAYLGDVIAPLKWLMVQRHQGGMDSSEYTLLTQCMESAIAERFDVGVRMFDHPVVKMADLWAMVIETSWLTVSGGEGWNVPPEVVALGPKPKDVRWDGGLNPAWAGLLFREALEALGVACR